MSNMAKIKQRIQALLAKANGTDNEHEAEAFLAKAMELLQQYQLDVKDLVDADDPIVRYVGLRQAKSGHAWRWKLYVAVGALYGCKNVIYQKPKLVSGKVIMELSVELVGRESSTITADLMFPWISQQVREHAKQLCKQTGMSEQGQAKRVAAALISRIYRLVALSKQEAPKTEAGKNALVILDQVEAFYKEQHGDLEAIRTGKSATDALSRKAADSIGLHRQTSGRETLRIGGHT